MRKIISLFMRNYDSDRLVRDEIFPGAEWVVAGDGVATRKFDGTSCMVRGRKLYKRYELKKGKTAPAGFEPAQEADYMTGDIPGWIPVGDGKEDRWHREAFQDIERPDGTYELVGPKVQGNPEHFPIHTLLFHGATLLPECPRYFSSLKHYFYVRDMEGVVWHHPDGRMVKIKAKDFGIHRGPGWSPLQ